jgi:hypothetical protein
VYPRIRKYQPYLGFPKEDAPEGVKTKIWITDAAKSRILPNESTTSQNIGAFNVNSPIAPAFAQ